jgi:hypothetical protein
MSEANYLCPLHKVLQTGVYRPKFNTILHLTIVNASMMISQELYRSVKHGCHCTSNYNTFDSIVQKMQETPSDPKDSEQTTQ